MTKIAKLLVAPAFILAAACGGADDESKMDDALSQDLALAASVQPYQPQQFMSPYEMQYGPQGYAPGYYPQPGYTPGAAPVYQRASQGGYTPAPAPRPAARRTTSSTGTVAREPVVTQRNTKRDAVIGAAAGAAIGAVTSRDRLKGAVIGAVAGGVLGGVIGHTVDVKRQ
jgi:hypothetical protein